MIFPKSNGGAALGGALVAFVLIVLQALADFFATGQTWPVTADGWVRLLLPAVVAGLLAMLTPYAQPPKVPPHG